MRYIVDCSLDEFQPWSGAVAVMDALHENADAFAAIECFIDEWCELREEPLRDVDINDFLWFDAVDYLWDSCGIDLYGDHEDEEDEEDE